MTQRHDSPPPGRNMVWIPGGAFTMGSNDHYAEEAPTRNISVKGFWMDRAPVTNADFTRFVAATGYRTVAEVPPPAEDYPGALPEQLIPASLVFTPPVAAINPQGSVTQWWAFVANADWKHPTGPGSNLDGLADHPVVHVALEDVEAYVEWAGLALPLEAEWEFAARGGLVDTEFAWGDTLTPDGVHLANTWQGPFPHGNTLDDGWSRTSPVGFYPANGFGLYDMIGNVWEWTEDWWSVPAEPAAKDACCSAAKPRGDDMTRSVDLRDPAAMPRRVLKGGSHLCAPNYCRRYRPAARHAHPIDTSTSHIGFRCVLRPA